MYVAPFMGAWIEIPADAVNTQCPWQSHPLWVRGLKFYSLCCWVVVSSVAPFMGAWIEIAPIITKET